MIEEGQGDAKRPGRPRRARKPGEAKKEAKDEGQRKPGRAGKQATRAKREETRKEGRPRRKKPGRAKKEAKEAATIKVQHEHL